VGDQALLLQGKSKDAVGRIMKKMDHMNQLAPEMLIELQKQNERIMKIDTQLNNIESTITRTGKYIKYFSRNFMTDRFIMVLLGLIVCAIVIVIIVACLGRSDKINNVVVIKK
jgi:t-SNARE complex subunit (syntaxin)